MIPDLVLRGIIGQSLKLAVAIVCTVGIVAGNLLEPQIVKWVVDDAILAGERGVWLRALLIWSGLFAVQHTLLAFQVAAMKRAEESEAAKLRLALFRGLTESHVTQIRVPDVSDVVVNHSKDVDDIKPAWSTIPILATFYSLTIIGALIASLLISLELTIYLLALTGILSLLAFAASKRATNAAQDCRETLERFINTVRTAAQNLRLVQVFKVQRYFRERLEERSQLLERHNVRLGMWQWAGGTLGDAASFCALAGVLIIGGARVASGEQTLGFLFAFLLYVNLVSQSFRDLLKQLVPYGRARAAARCLSPFLRFSEDIPAGAKVNIEKVQTVEIVDVSFEYPTMGREILRNCSQRFAPGVPHVIVGSNGVGKSTLMNILSGYLAPSKGTVCINGVNLAEINPDFYWDVLALVTAEDMILEISVYDNLLIGRSDITKSEIESVLAELRLVCGAKDVAEFLKSDATALSSGTKRKLAVARALLKNASLYLIDEPSANLDDESCRSLSEVLERLAMSAVVVVTSQDPRLHFDAAYTYRLEDGNLQRLQRANRCLLQQ